MEILTANPTIRIPHNFRNSKHIQISNSQFSLHIFDPLLNPASPVDNFHFPFSIFQAEVSEASQSAYARMASNS